MEASGSRLANFAFFVAKKFWRRSLFRLAARLLEIRLIWRVLVNLAVIDGELALIDDSGGFGAARPADQKLRGRRIRSVENRLDFDLAWRKGRKRRRARIVVGEVVEDMGEVWVQVHLSCLSIKSANSLLFHICFAKSNIVWPRKSYEWRLGIRV